MLCFSWRKSCFSCRIPKENEGENYADEAVRRIISVSNPLSMAVSSSRPNYGESSPQQQYRSLPLVRSPPPQQYLLQQHPLPGRVPPQPAPETSTSDEIRKVVKCPENDSKELKLQRESGPITQGLSRTPHEAEIPKEQDLILKDPTDSRDLVVEDKDLFEKNKGRTDPEDPELEAEISKEKELFLKDLIAEDYTKLKDLVVKIITDSKDPDSKESSDLKGPDVRDLPDPKNKDLIDPDLKDSSDSEG